MAPLNLTSDLKTIMEVPKQLIRRVVIDVICLILAALPWAVTEFGAATPVQRGFFCDDESLNHPYHDSTFSTILVFFLGMTLNIGVILVTELIHYFTKKKAKLTPRPKEVDGVSVNPVVYLCYNAILAFLIGCAIQQTIVNIMKFSVGRLRPHFIDVCKPNWTAIECVDPVSKQNRYVEDPHCLGTNLKHLNDMRLSFPSGHSSMSTYSMIFCAMYLHARLTWRGSRLLRHFIQAGLIYVSTYICVSRISDYKHHWSDVLAGFLIGLVFAILTGRYVWDFFERPNWRKILPMKKSEDGPTATYDIGQDGTHPTSPSLEPAEV